MMRFSIALAALVVVAAGAADELKNNNVVPLHPFGETQRKRWIGRLKDVSEAQVDEQFAGYHGVRKMRVGKTRFVVFDATHKELHRLRHHSARTLEYVEPDQIMSIDSHVSCPEVQSTNLPWGLGRVTSQSLENYYMHAVTWGSGVDAYIVDTGVHCGHVEFAGRCTWGPKFVQGGKRDDNGHGTHVAGTVAGTTYGVAKSAHVIAVKVLDRYGSGWLSDIIKGIDWAVDEAASRPTRRGVINLSLGGGYSLAFNNAIAAAVGAGVQVAAAAGNGNTDACSVSPGSEHSSVTVGSTTSSDARSSFSNWGTCVDVWAPGSDIRSSWPSCDTCSATLSGTSMAAPHVAGVMAAYLSLDPTLTSGQLKTHVLDAAMPGYLSGLLGGSPDKLLHLPCTPCVCPSV
eukprot:Hpha_TRINITY_DN14619_c0_g1::TRINITY_DN14619_c0_g1_i5::g.47747::m.47747